MNRIRTLVVDDELLAREGLRLRLEPHPDIEVVGVVGRATRAVSAIRDLAPDLVFLDVQMPGLSGFEVLGKLDPDRLPLVIFVTAHDQYALRAFRAHALDYLLKPVDDVLFVEALDRARRELASRREGAAARRLRALLSEVGLAPTAPGPEQRIERIQLKEQGRIRFVPVGEIDWISGEGDYVRLHAGGHAFLVRERLSALERKLDAERFVRIHRSTIVAIRVAKELQPYFHGDYVLLTTSGARLRVSRTHKNALARALGVAL